MHIAYLRDKSGQFATYSAARVICRTHAQPYARNMSKVETDDKRRKISVIIGCAHIGLLPVVATALSSYFLYANACISRILSTDACMHTIDVRFSPVYHSRPPQRHLGPLAAWTAHCTRTHHRHCGLCLLLGPGLPLTRAPAKRELPGLGGGCRGGFPLALCTLGAARSPAKRLVRPKPRAGSCQIPPVCMANETTIQKLPYFWCTLLA